MIPENQLQDIKAGNIVNLIKPAFPRTIGQGKEPEGMMISKNNKEYLLKWNTAFKISETCDNENKIADLNHNPPLIHENFVLENNNSFEIINQERSSDNEIYRDKNGRD